MTASSTRNPCPTANKVGTFFLSVSAAVALGGGSASAATPQALPSPVPSPVQRPVIAVGPAKTLSASGAPTAARRTDMQFKVSLGSRIGYHLMDKVDLATHRYSVEIEQKMVFKPTWTFVASGRAYAEAAYSMNRVRYPRDSALQDSSEIVPRDIYVQYKSSPLTIRAGNQQVVWGEAFGFYYADIVNPKDLREFVLGDLEAQRIPTPLLNVKLVYPHTSYQVIYIPKPYFNRMPSLGTDFAPDVSALIPNSTLTVNDDRTLPLSFNNGEVGGRITCLLSPVDMSVFFLSYYDRMPNYSMRVTSLSPLSLELNATHNRIWTAGATATADLSAILLRMEGLYTKSRYFDTYTNGVYSSLPSDQVVAVVGMDYTRIEKWRLGVQGSVDFLTNDIQNTVLSRNRYLASLHTDGTPLSNHRLDANFNLAPEDKSSLIQIQYLIPMSNSLEFKLATDLLFGSPTSQFGQFHNGSRAYAQLRAYLVK